MRSLFIVTIAFALLGACSSDDTPGSGGVLPGDHGVSVDDDAGETDAADATISDAARDVDAD